MTWKELVPFQLHTAPYLGQKKGEPERDPLPSSSLTQGSDSTSITMEHGHIQVSGASMSLETVFSVVSSRAVSNQDIVPEIQKSPPKRL